VQYRLDRPVTVLIDADGHHQATWVDRPGPELAALLGQRLEEHLEGQGLQGRRHAS
jgi:hypothetical protein